MNSLYEITTGRLGESYERAYVWAVTELYALSLFHAKYPDYKTSQLRCTFLFSADAEPFCSKISDCDLDMEGVPHRGDGT